ncbi:MAG: hypothetical protein ACWGSQ_11475 [Longimicrobiales bacterium]
MQQLRTSLVKTVAVFLLSAFSPFPTHAQEDPSPQEAPQTGGLVRLFLDCQASGCRDMDFFRTEIQFVNWVRDRMDSAVHLLITSQTPGAGGRSYELLFMGSGRYETMADTIPYVSGFDATEDEVRRGLAGVMKIGLMRYVGLTSIAGRIAIGLGEPAPGPQRGGPGQGRGAMATAEDDPWNFWVFRVGLNVNSGGESTYGSLGVGGSFTASRTTEEWKVSLGLRTSYDENEFEYDDYTELSVQRSSSFSGLVVRSLTDHWSAGLRGGVTNSTYYNYRLNLMLAPVLEYNVFPYAESTRRMLTLQYALEGSYADYYEQSIYFEEEETLLAQSLAASLDLTQPWGSSNIFMEAGHYLHDIDLHHASIGGSINVRLARGFSVNVFGSLGTVKDRISVAGGDASVEDVLLRRRLFETEYEYFTYISFNYTFGSIFNNIVNPRIGRGGGGMIIMH